ncbi:GH25 family lysozyme, partial [Enterococcus sp. 2201sp1_2201st1_B8_2201SCRN_220225]
MKKKYVMSTMALVCIGGGLFSGVVSSAETIAPSVTTATSSALTSTMQSEEVSTSTSTENDTEMSTDETSQTQETNADSREEISEGTVESTTTSTTESESTIESSSTDENTANEIIDETTNKAMGSSFASQRNSLARGTFSKVIAGDVNTPSANFIDVSSHNGTISVATYKEMMKFGITGVVVKATEGTSYKNDYYFPSQVRNALAAGLKVSVYHYAHYTSASQAVAEANYFVNYVSSMNLGKSINMVIDIEESKMANGSLSANTVAFKNRLNALGYSNVLYYCSGSWLTEYGVGGELSAEKLGYDNFWVAHYPTSLSANMNWYSDYSSWQWSSQYVFSANSNAFFDINQDYNGRFTNPKPIDSG